MINPSCLCTADHSLTTLGDGKESKTGRAPKTESNRETVTKRHLRPLDVLTGLVRPNCIHFPLGGLTALSLSCGEV